MRSYRSRNPETSDEKSSPTTPFMTPIPTPLQKKQPKRAAVTTPIRSDLAQSTQIPEDWANSFGDQNVNQSQIEEMKRQLEHKTRQLSEKEHEIDSLHHQFSDSQLTNLVEVNDLRQRLKKSNNETNQMKKQLAEKDQELTRNYEKLVEKDIMIEAYRKDQLDPIELETIRQLSDKEQQLSILQSEHDSLYHDNDDMIHDLDDQVTVNKYLQSKIRGFEHSVHKQGGQGEIDEQISKLLAHIEELEANAKILERELEKAQIDQEIVEMKSVKQEEEQTIALETIEELEQLIDQLQSDLQEASVQSNPLSKPIVETNLDKPDVYDQIDQSPFRWMIIAAMMIPVSIAAGMYFRSQNKNRLE